jgi:hypothetical protein
MYNDSIIEDIGGRAYVSSLTTGSLVSDDITIDALLYVSKLEVKDEFIVDSKAIFNDDVAIDANRLSLGTKNVYQQLVDVEHKTHNQSYNSGTNITNFTHDVNVEGNLTIDGETINLDDLISVIQKTTDITYDTGTTKTTFSNNVQIDGNLKLGTIDDVEDSILNISDVINHDDLQNIHNVGSGVSYGHISDGEETLYGQKTFHDNPIISKRLAQPVAFGNEPCLFLFSDYLGGEGNQGYYGSIRFGGSDSYPLGSDYSYSTSVIASSSGGNDMGPSSKPANLEFYSSNVNEIVPTKRMEIKVDGNIEVENDLTASNILTGSADLNFIENVKNYAISPMIVSGGVLSEGTNVGTYKSVL